MWNVCFPNSMHSNFEVIHGRRPISHLPGYTTVTIYDQSYHLTGQNPGHVHRLAALVDSKMRAVAAQGRTVDSLRVAVLAALNLADELSQCRGRRRCMRVTRAL